MNKTEKLQLARTKLKQYQDRKSNPEASSPIPDDVESSLEASSLLKTDLIISLEFQLQELQNKFTLEIETKNFSITNLVNENEKLHILLQESNSRNLKLDIANKDIEASLTELRARHVEIHKEKLSLVSENQALIDSLNSSNDNGLKSGLDSDDKKELDFLRSRELTDAKERSDFIDKLNELETLSKDLKTQNEVMNALLKKREINRFGESTETSLIYNDDDPDEIIQQQLEFLTVSVKALEKDKIDLELIVSNLQQDLKSEQKISALLQGILI